MCRHTQCMAVAGVMVEWCARYVRASRKKLLTPSGGPKKTAPRRCCELRLEDWEVVCLRSYRQRESMFETLIYSIWN